MTAQQAVCFPLGLLQKCSFWKCKIELILWNVAKVRSAGMWTQGTFVARKFFESKPMTAGSNPTSSRQCWCNTVVRVWVLWRLYFVLCLHHISHASTVSCMLKKPFVPKFKCLMTYSIHLSKSQIDQYCTLYRYQGTYPACWYYM